MKIWNSYGSEHSANLVMIGHFQTKIDAEEAKSAIDRIAEYLNSSGERYDGSDRFSKEMLDLLIELKLHTFHPAEIDQFVYDVSVKTDDARIVITTDESDISAFLKVLLEHDAKVEVYSAHTHKGTGEGR